MTFDNFIIRQISTKDSKQYFSFINENRDRISRYFPKTCVATRDLAATITHISERIKLAEKREYITFVILDNISEKVIGAIFLKDIDWNIPKAELGFFIDKDYEGKGIITKSLSLVCDKCLYTLGLNKIFIRIAEDNISSRRVAEKNRFIVEGTLRNDYKTPEGVLIDVMYYGRIPSIGK